MAESMIVDAMDAATPVEFGFYLRTNQKDGDPALVHADRPAPLRMQPDQDADGADFQGSARQPRKTERVRSGEVRRRYLHRPDQTAGGDETADSHFGVSAHMRQNVPRN